MDYQPYAALLHRNGPVHAVGFEWLLWIRKLLDTKSAELKDAKWLSPLSAFNSLPPDIKKETTYEKCVDAEIGGNLSGTFSIKLTLWDGDYSGFRTFPRCSWKISVDPTALDFIPCNAFDATLQWKVRQLAIAELERKETKEREIKIALQEQALLYP